MSPPPGGVVSVFLATIPAAREMEITPEGLSKVSRGEEAIHGTEVKGLL